MLALSSHARARMRRRHITEEEIEEALLNVLHTHLSADSPDRIVVFGTTRNGRRLKVVVLDADPGYVITVAAQDEEG